MGAPGEPSFALPRTPRWVFAAVLAASVLVTFGASIATGPTFDEERRVAAARHATDLARAFGQFGPGTLVSSSARGVYDDLAPFGVLPGLLSGWLGEVLRQTHLLDGLTAARFGWLLVAAFAPFSLFVLVNQSRGLRTAVLAVALLLATPRFLHALGAARESAVVTSLWLLALATYVVSRPPSPRERRAGARRPFRAGAIAFAVVIGIGVSIDLATLWILPVVVGHYLATARPGVRRALRRGRAPLPAAFLWTILLTPAVLLAATPTLWRGGAVSAAEWLFSPLAPTIEPLLYGGVPVVSYKDVPSAYAVHFLGATTPAPILLLAAAGVVLGVAEARRARRTGERRDETALVSLALFMLLAVCVGPALAPRVLTRFPPRVEAALPFVAALAAVALDRVVARLAGPDRVGWATALVASLVVGLGVRGVSTAAAAFNAFARGTQGAVASRRFSIGDGSEVAPLAAAIDALSVPQIVAPSGDVSRAYWTLLSDTGRLKTPVVPHGGLELSVTRGTKNGAVARVERDGAVLWSLVRR